MDDIRYIRERGGRRDMAYTGRGVAAGMREAKAMPKQQRQRQRQGRKKHATRKAKAKGQVLDTH